MWELDCKESWEPKNWCFWTVVLEKTLECPLEWKEIQPAHPKGNQFWIFIGRTDIEAETQYWKLKLKPNTLATWCEELTHWKRPWYWERLKVGGEGDDRGWDGWMASPTQWTWVWVNSGSWWWTGRPGVLQSMGSQRVGHNWATELNVFPCYSPLCPSFFCYISCSHTSARQRVSNCAQRISKPQDITQLPGWVLPASPTLQLPMVVPGISKAGCGAVEEKSDTHLGNVRLFSWLWPFMCWKWFHSDFVFTSLYIWKDKSIN